MKQPEDLHPSRHVFRGHASGVTAHIRRPKDAVLAAKGSSSLPVIGGRSQSKVGKTRLGKWVSFDSAQTLAHGDYVDAAHGVAATHGDPFTAPAETRVTSRVRNLSILGKVKIKNLSLGLVTRSAKGNGQPSVTLEGNRIDGVTIDGAKLKVTLAESFFSKNNTKERLQAALGKSATARQAYCIPPAQDGAGEGTEADGAAQCTIVQSLAWQGKPHPEAEIHRHVVVVPNFGKIYFGEMFVTNHSRRLTLVRFQLGSEDGGEVTGGDGESGTQTYPPTRG